MADVFISYSRKDKDFVRRLDESLKSRGREAWVDWNDIRPTEEWMQAIYAAIEGADTFVFVLTPDSVASVICGREIAHAAARNKRMVPIIAREVNADTVPEALAKLNWIFCRESDDFEKATDTLITAFDTDLDWVRAHTRLLTRALEWEANKKSNSFVLRGEDLRAAEQWLAQAGTGKERQPTTLQTEYIIGSRKAAERRQRIISGAVSFGLIVSIILTIIALTQRHQAVEQKNIADQRRAEAERETRVATAQRLAAQADGALERFPQRSLLLSVEAVEVARRQNEPPVPDAEQSLRRALAAVGGRGFGGVGLPIFAFAISPDSRWLAMGGQNKAYLWDLTRSGSNVPVVLTNLEGDVTGVAFDRDGHSLVAVGPKFGVRLWDLTGTMPVPKQLSLPDQTNEKLWGRLSADNRCVLTATKDGAFALWKLTIPDPTKNPVSFPPGTPIELLDITLKVSTILMSAEGRWLAVKESGKPARLWNLADPQSPLVLHDSDGPLPEMALSPDSRWLVAAGQDHAIRLWDLTASDPSAPSRVLRGHEGDLTAIAFSADSRWLVTSGDDQTARVWDLSATDPERASIVLRGHGDMIRRVSISSDGRWLITSNIVNRLDPNRKPDTSAWLWDLSLTDAAAKPFELSGHEAGVSDAIVTSDGRWAITGSDGGSVRLWDLTSKLPSSTPLVLRGHEGGIYKLSVSADNRWLVAQGMDSSVRVWDLRTPQPATTPLVLDGGASAASPDSHWLVVGDQLLELAAPNHAVTKLILGDPERKRVPSRTAFTADSHWLVASDEFARSQLLDLTASQIAEAASILDKADGAINVLEMSPDSHWLVMSRQYQNTEARLWDLRSQNSSREPFTLRGHRKAITRAAISRDSRWLVTGSDAATVESRCERSIADAHRPRRTREENLGLPIQS